MAIALIARKTMPINRNTVEKHFDYCAIEEICSRILESESIIVSRVDLLNSTLIEDLSEV